MKYIVEVNAKWLVSIEAETLLEAEHKILELNGIWGALAFDVAMMKTETFAGVVQFCEMISMDELKDYVDQYEVGWHNFAKAKDEYHVYESEVKRIENELSLAKANLRIAAENVKNAEQWANEATDHIGRQRD